MAYPPYSFLDEEGKPQGHDVEIMNALADKLNVQVEYRLRPWAEALQSLKDGEVDALIGVIYLDKRKEFFDFTIPTWFDSYAIFARSSAVFENLDNLRKGRIVALSGDASISRFIEPMGLEESTQFVDTLPDAFQLVENGEGDFVLAPYSIGMEIIDRHNFRTIRVVGPSILPSLYCIAVRKGDSDLLAAFNSAIDISKMEGVIQRINHKWFSHYREEDSLRELVRMLRFMLVPGTVFVLFLLLWLWSLRRQVRKRTAQLQASEQQFRTLANNVPGVVYRCANDTDWTMEYISKGVADLSGYNADEFIRNRVRSFASVIHPDDRDSVYEDLQNAVRERRPFIKEYRLLHRDGSVRWVHETGQGVFDAEGNLLYLDGVILDIGDRKHLEDELRQYATTDTATGMYNRRFGLVLFEKHLSFARRAGQVLSICYIDINNLKAVNDRFGHQEGDALISRMSGIFKDSLRDSDVLCRVGGDEFLIIFPDTNAAGAEAVWDRIVGKMKEENQRESCLYPLSASHGIVESHPQSTASMEELISLADTRMYEEKRYQKEQDAAQS